MREPVTNRPESRGSRGLTLVTVALANVLAVVDYNIVSVAMPDLQRTFPGTGLAELSWVMNGYTIVFAAVLLPAGGLADRYGSKRLFLAGMAVFSLASLLCALAPAPLWLVFGRMLQAVGGGAMVTTTLSIGLVVLPDARSRLLHITDAGRDKRAEAQRRWRAAQEKLNTLLGLERVLALHAMLDEAIDLLRAEDGDEGEDHE